MQQKQTLNLCILRHGEAPSSMLGDRERTLSPRGKEQAETVGQTLADRGLKPDIVLCSSVQRTRQTYAGVENKLGKTEVIFADEIYHASANDLLEIIQSVPGSNKTLLLIGHNPAVHQFAKTLTGSGPEEKIQQLNLFYKPCTLSVFECPIKDWKDLRPGIGKLTDLVIPD